MCPFWARARSGVVYDFADDQCLRLYSNRKLSIFHRHPPKEAEFHEQKKNFYFLERTSFSFVERYLAAKVTLGFWSAVDGLDWVPFTWETEELHSIDPHRCVRRENPRNVFVVHPVVVLYMPGRFIRADAEAAYSFFC